MRKSKTKIILIGCELCNKMNSCKWYRQWRYMPPKMIDWIYNNCNEYHLATLPTLLRRNKLKFKLSKGERL